MAGVMNCDLHLTDKLAVYKREVDTLGLTVVPPCINRSLATFTVREGQLVYALGALKNVGVEAMRMIVAARQTGHGEKPFVSLFDVARRVDLKRLGKRPMEMLARAGAFDELDPNRRRVFESLDALTAYSAAVHEAQSSSQVSLFGEAGEDLPEPRLPTCDDWLPVERLGQEHQAVGFYLSGHPLDDYMPALKRKSVLTLAELSLAAEAGPMVAKIAGTVSARQERKSAKGNRFAFVSLSDPSGLYEVTVFSDTLEAARQHLEPGKAVVLTVEATLEGETLKLLARAAQPIDAVAADAGAGALRIHVDSEAAVVSVAVLLKRMLAEQKSSPTGTVSFCIADHGTGAEIEITAGRAFPVNPLIKGAIKSVAGVMLVEDL
jgi:DNA polymerase-3 subunit alpha